MSDTTRTAADVVLDALYDSGHLSPAETAERIRKYLDAERWHVVRYEPHGGLSGREYDEVTDRWLVRATITEEWTAPGLTNEATAGHA